MGGCAHGRLPRQVLLMLQAALTHMFFVYKREGDTRMLVIRGKARYGGDTSDVAEMHRWSDSVLTHCKYTLHDASLQKEVMGG